MFASATGVERPSEPNPPLEAGRVVPDFERLYEEYIDFVCRNSRRLGVTEAALDDVVQDVFLVAHRRLNDVRKPESLKAWMLSIVIRVVRDYRRTTRRKRLGKTARDTELDLDQVPDTLDHNPQTMVEHADAVRLLYRLLSELDDAKREVFVSAELEDMSEQEIAEATGENVNTVHSRLRAARKSFEQALQREQAREQWRQR